MLPNPYERPTLTVAEAGHAFGLGRSASYEAIHRGDFPVPTIRVGRRLLVPTASLLRILGLFEEPAGADQAVQRESAPDGVTAVDPDGHQPAAWA